MAVDDIEAPLPFAYVSGWCYCYKEIQNTSSGQKKEAPKIRLCNFIYIPPS